MSDHDLLQGIGKQVDKLSAKMDSLIDAVSDMRAHNQVTDHRFDEHSRRHDEADKRIDEVNEKAIARVEKLEKKLEDGYVKNETFAPFKRFFIIVAGVIVTAITTAVISLVIIKDPSAIIHKPSAPQQTSQPK